VFFFNDVDDVIMKDLDIDSFSVGVQVAKANTPNEGSNQINERIGVLGVSATNVGSAFQGPGEIDGSIELLVVEESFSSLVELPQELVKNYYVCNNGVDSNTGDSPLSPFLTFERGMKEFNTLRKGGGVYFCRGGRFNVTENVELFNPNCSADFQCIISDYLSSEIISEDKPEINSVNGFTVFNFQDRGNADRDGGYIIKNIYLKTALPDRAGVSLYNDVDDVIMDGLIIDGFKWGVYSAGANTPNEGSNKINERIVLKNSKVINNSAQGWLGGCTNCIIESNYFDNNGYAAKILNHNIYMGGKEFNSNVTIRNNTLKNSAIVNGECTGVSLVVHGNYENLIIEGNLILEQKGKAGTGCWGISVDPGWEWQEEAFYNVTIKGNIVVNTGNVGIGCASCVGGIIESNVIINDQPYKFSGIKVPVREEGNIKSSDIIIKGNNITLLGDPGLIKAGIQIADINLQADIQGNSVFLRNENYRCAIMESDMESKLSGCELFIN